ncbi:hypothetical protein B0H13DRAFT_416320 [Mycena leptocephala]|nr:hypothetical protein B0H13DRAFT_416320 [Mycena leptocephala]
MILYGVFVGDGWSFHAARVPGWREDAILRVCAFRVGFGWGAKILRRGRRGVLPLRRGDTQYGLRHGDDGLVARAAVRPATRLLSPCIPHPTHLRGPRLNAHPSPGLLRMAPGASGPPRPVLIGCFALVAFAGSLSTALKIGLTASSSSNSHPSPSYTAPLSALVWFLSSCAVWGGRADGLIAVRGWCGRLCVAHLNSSSLPT